MFFIFLVFLRSIEGFFLSLGIFSFPIGFLEASVLREVKFLGDVQFELVDVVYTGDRTVRYHRL